MTDTYITARDAILCELEAAEAALKGSEAAYESTERALQEAQRRAQISYDGRAENRRNVDRLKKALAIIEGDE